MPTRGARQKLNSIYLTGAAIVAGFVGLIFKSVTIFIICFGGIVAAMFHDGSFRPKPTRRR
jgi:hypothetical protein